MSSFFNAGIGGVQAGTSVGEATVGINANPIKGSVGAGIGGIEAGNTGFSLSASASPLGVSVGPRVTFGTDDPGAVEGGAIGGTVGGTAGSLFGPVGSAAGTLVGSMVGSLLGKGTGKSKGSLEHDARNSARKQFFPTGVELLLPDGTNANFALDGQEGKHSWKNPSKRTDKEGDRELFAYETDYTNDMDYISSMGGITLARLLGGGANKIIDQFGQLIGNQALGKVGHGNELTQENFNSVMTNLRAIFSDKGINSKDDLLGLANKAFSEGRVEDFDYNVMQQTASLVFDQDFAMAQQLMGGRWGGVETATRVPDQSQFGRTESGQPRLLTMDEAKMAVDPLISHYKDNLSLRAKGMKYGPSSNAVRNTALAGGAALLNQGVEALTGQGIGSHIADAGEYLYNEVADWLWGSDTVSDPALQLPEFDFGLF